MYTQLLTEIDSHFAHKSQHERLIYIQDIILYTHSIQMFMLSFLVTCDYPSGK